MDKHQTAGTVEDLMVFQRAYRLSLIIHKVSLGFPKYEQYGLCDQVRRASKSICANLAEGFAKKMHSQAEFRRYLLMALGSADEMRVWCMFVLDLGYLDETTANSWKQEYQEIAKMLQGLIRKS